MATLEETWRLDSDESSFKLDEVRTITYLTSKTKLLSLPDSTLAVNVDDFGSAYFAGKTFPLLFPAFLAL